MKKSYAAIALAIVALLAIGGAAVLTNHKAAPSPHDDMGNMAASQPQTTQPSNQVVATNVVDIKDFAYAPAKITVKKGTKVTWTNSDSAKHDITPDKESADFTASELLAKGESYSFTFNTAGTFAYHCSPHPYMKASVEVTE